MTVWRNNIGKGYEEIKESSVDTFEVVEMVKHWESNIYTLSHQQLPQIVSYESQFNRMNSDSAPETLGRACLTMTRAEIDYNKERVDFCPLTCDTRTFLFPLT